MMIHGRHTVCGPHRVWMIQRERSRTVKMMFQNEEFRNDTEMAV